VNTHVAAAAALQWAWILLSGPAAADTLARSTTSIYSLVADADHGRVLYLKHCRSCHGEHAFGDGPRAIPSLAGQREDYLIKQLTEFATDKREGISMHEVMRRPDLDWAQSARDLAAYLSQAQRSPGPETGEGDGLATARSLYQAQCQECHGARGQGVAAGIPAIGGQHYRYVLAQLQDLANGHRNAGPSANMATVSAATRKSIADYISRLSHLTADDPEVSRSGH